MKRLMCLALVAVFFAISSVAEDAEAKRGGGRGGGRRGKLTRLNHSGDDGNHVIPAYYGPVDADYVGIVKDKPECTGFSSTYFEKTNSSPIKRCECCGKVVLTNLFCQCPECRN